MNIMHIINTNLVWGRLSENYLTKKLIVQNISDLQYMKPPRVNILPTPLLSLSPPSLSLSLANMEKHSPAVKLEESVAESHYDQKSVPNDKKKYA